MDKRLGVYLCTGCSIGGSLDVAKLAGVAKSECKAEVCRSHHFLCGEEGRTQIRADVTAGAVNTVVVAACSPRVKSECFSFNDQVVCERVNLREHVVWSHEAKAEDTQMLAE